MQDRILDRAARVLGSLLFGALAVAQVYRLHLHVQLMALAGRVVWRDVLLEIVPTLANLAFLALLAVLFLVRGPAIRKATGIVPRVVGALGMFGLAIGLTLLRLQGPAPVVPVLLWTGTAIAAVAHAAAVWILATLGRSFSVMPEARRLVVSGPYALVRHPLYAAEILAGLGLVLMQPSPWAWIALAGHVGCALGRIHYEEQVLGAAFPEYGAYRQRVPQLIPGLR